MIDRHQLILTSTAARKFNSLVYYWRQKRWRVDPRFRPDPLQVIDRPVFLLGIQGGGLTIISRILHRHRDTVSASGDYRHWASDDESQNVYRSILPEELTWKPVEVDEFTIKEFDAHGHNWVFATDALLKHYHGSRADASPELSKALTDVIRSILSLNGSRPAAPKRFIDKSQSLSVRVGLLQALLHDCDPRFVLVVRNPFAAIWRAATGDKVITNLGLPIERRVEIATQHWRNLYQSALQYEGDGLAVWKFEDFLGAPDRVIREICEHIDLPYTPEILPGPDDRIPLGSMYDAFSLRKWYPLRTDVNDRYLQEIPDWARTHIAAECADLIERFVY